MAPIHEISFRRVETRGGQLLLAGQADVGYHSRRFCKNRLNPGLPKYYSPDIYPIGGKPFDPVSQIRFGAFLAGFVFDPLNEK